MSGISMSSQFTVRGLQFKCKQMLFVFLLSAICYLSSFTQTVSQLTKAGDKKIAEGDYYAASLYFKDALKKDEENIDLNILHASAYLKFKLRLSRGY